MDRLEKRHGPHSNGLNTHGREVVTHHAGLASVGHDAVNAAPPRMHDGAGKAPASTANAAFNDASCCGPAETTAPGRIVAAIKTS
jgi:hypothetical protein